MLEDVNVPLLERNTFFNPSNLFSTLSTTGFRETVALELAPKGIPNYFNGHEPTSQPMNPTLQPTSHIFLLPYLLYQRDFALLIFKLGKHSLTLQY